MNRIMTPELKSLSLIQAAQVKTDLLVVLLGPQPPDAHSPLGAWVHQAVKAGDLDLSLAAAAVLVLAAGGVLLAVRVLHWGRALENAAS